MCVCWSVCGGGDVCGGNDFVALVRGRSVLQVVYMCNVCNMIYVYCI